MLTIIDMNGTGVPIQNGFIWSVLGVVIAIELGLYALRSIAVYGMARRKGIEKAWIAFIPLVWFLVVCKLISNVKIFKTTLGKIAIVFFIVFAISEVLVFAYDFLSYFPLVGNVLSGRTVYLVMSETVPQNLSLYWVESSGIYVDANFVYPYGYNGAYPTHMLKWMSVIYTVSSVFDLLSIIVLIIVYTNLFKAYWPQNYMIGLVLSILGLFPILVFVIRKREPVDYNEYMKARYNAFMYGSYNNPTGANRRPAPPTPFEEFAEKGEVDPGEPFTEFEEKDDTKEKEE